MIRAIAAAAGVILLATGGVLAEDDVLPQCAPYADQAAALLRIAGEVPVARMLSDRGHLIEILASPDGDSFTVLSIQADQQACIVEIGTTYSAVPPAGTAS